MKKLAEAKTPINEAQRLLQQSMKDLSYIKIEENNDAPRDTQTSMKKHEERKPKGNDASRTTQPSMKMLETKSPKRNDAPRTTQPSMKMLETKSQRSNVARQDK